MDWKLKRSLSHFHFISSFSAPATFYPFQSQSSHTPQPIPKADRESNKHARASEALVVRQRNLGRKKRVNLVMEKRWWGNGSGGFGEKLA
jgi:hypothetical protein